MSAIFNRPALIFTEDKKIEKQIDRALFTLQYSVDTAMIESEAVKMVKEIDYFLIIIVERQGRQLDTLGLYKKIVAAKPAYKNSVIFVSESLFGVLAEEVKQLGCQLIPKPFHAENLATALEEMRAVGLFKENRHENRYNSLQDCIIKSGNNTAEAKTMDISMGGTKIRFQSLTVKNGDIIDIAFKDIGHATSATVKWTFNMGDKMLAGLELSESIKLEDLKKVVPFAAPVSVKK